MAEDDLITLVCPIGQDTHTYPISSHGDEFEPFPETPGDPNSRWLIHAHRAAAAEFLHKGGFALVSYVQRRQLSGQVTPLVHADGPFSLSFEGAEHHSEETEMPNGAVVHVVAFPSEGVGDVVGVHPGVSVLSLADYLQPEGPTETAEAPAKAKRSK